MNAECQLVIDLIESKVLSKECDGESKVFFLKMVGDYYRYIAENAKDDLLDQVKLKALRAYKKANNITLPPCNLVKLGLAVNFSVFMYEVMKSYKMACEIADMAQSEAIDNLDPLEEEEFRDVKGLI
jgi:14-3-3 protein epsilon